MPVTNTKPDSVHVTGDNNEETPVATRTDVRYSIKYPSFSEADISSNMDTIADMEAVATIDASKLEKTGKSPMDTFNEYFDSLGNNIASETFGDIALPKSSAKSEIRHGITAEKIASIEAIPAVIEQGKAIFHKAKEGGVERIVVCAPIKIGNIDYYMGVMLQRDARYQRLYLHNVVSVAIEREATSSSKDNLVTTGALEDENHLSITSIIQKALNVKAEKQKTAKNHPKKRFALTENAETKVIHGYTLNKNAVVNEDLLEELRIYDPSAEVSADGRITVYHRTSEESADAIRKTGIMRAEEDALFFSSKSEGYASGYGWLCVEHGTG